MIHDLELLRISKGFCHYSKPMRWRLKREELDELNEFDAIIVHNEIMKSYMTEQLGISREKMVTLGIFDYLIPEDTHFPEAPSNYKSCIIAGILKRASRHIYIICRTSLNLSCMGQIMMELRKTIYTITDLFMPEGIDLRTSWNWFWTSLGWRLCENM